MFVTTIAKRVACVILPGLILSVSDAQTPNDSPVPGSSRQMVLVVTNSMSASKGTLFRFERNGGNSTWERVGEPIPVVLGRNGLAWGRGLHMLDSSKVPVKREGDGKSPAGVFTLGSAFGYSPKEKLPGLRIPYVHVAKMLECVDDSNSKFYNELVLRNSVDRVDWHSSEQMYLGGIWYALGIVVHHNAPPAMKGAGSCIFLHNWSTPDESSAGCTEMAPAHMKELTYWMDSSRHPILVQLSRQLFDQYRVSWELPGIPARGGEQDPSRSGEKN